MSRLTKALAAAREETTAALRAERDANWPDQLRVDEPVSLAPLRDAIEHEMSKQERRQARCAGYRQRGELL